MTERIITISVRNESGAWEVIDSEHGAAGQDSLVEPVVVAARDIGGDEGQGILVQLWGDANLVLDSREITAG